MQCITECLQAMHNTLLSQSVGGGLVPMVKTCAAVEHAASAATRSIGAEGGERGARARAGRAVSRCSVGDTTCCQLITKLLVL